MINIFSAVGNLICSTLNEGGGQRFRRLEIEILEHTLADVWIIHRAVDYPPESMAPWIKPPDPRIHGAVDFFK